MEPFLSIAIVIIANDFIFNHSMFDIKHNLELIDYNEYFKLKTRDEFDFPIHG